MRIENGAWDGQVIWGSVRSNAGILPDLCDEEGAEPAGKTLDLPVDHFNPHLWLQALGSDWKNEIAESGQKWVFPCSLSQKVAWSRTIVSLHQKEPVLVIHACELVGDPWVDEEQAEEW